MIFDIDAHFEPGPEWLDPYPGLEARLPEPHPGASAYSHGSRRLTAMGLLALPIEPCGERVASSSGSTGNGLAPQWAAAHCATSGGIRA